MKLHDVDIVCEQQIWGWSLGVLSLGKFAGNDVAIKKTKEVDPSERSMDEFVREVKMLDKFRFERIVHFYSSCSIRNHVMMMGFAPRESLMDCIKKPEEPSADIKEKVMVDAAPGLAYLHANGIPHRDIQPDNVIFFSFDQVLEGNGKLNDFGSSRNVNMRM